MPPPAAAKASTPAPWMAASVDYAEPEPPPPPTIEAVAAPTPAGPVDTPWARQEAARTEIETVKPPDELVRPAGPPGIICPSCRTENDPSRRFCQSCGTPLVATAPVQVVTPRPRRRSWLWVLVLIPIVIVAGVIGFGGAAFLKGGLPAAATPGPTGSAAPGVSGGPSGSSGSSGPTASTAVGPSVHLLRLHHITSSGSRDTAHSPGKSIDGDPATSWQTDTKGGKQVWLEVSFVGNGIVDLTTITILPGDQKSAAAFKASRRPHHVQISVDGKPAMTVELKDQSGAQDIAVALHVTKVLRITVLDSYSGASSTMCAISDMRFVGTTT